MPLPRDVEDAAAQLAAIYAIALSLIRAELASIAEESNRARLERRLRGLARTLERLLDEADQQAWFWIDSTLPRLYERGMGSFVVHTAALSDATAADVLTSFSMPSRPAVERLAAGLSDDLLSATRHVTEDAKRVIRSAVRSGSLAKVVEGRSLRDAQREVTAHLEGLGIGSVRYRNGARMPIDAYAGMAVRSTTALAYNGGLLDAGRANGVEWFEVFDGPGCGWSDHDDPDEADGSIRHADDCEANPMAHPHCRRSFGSRPEITSAEDAANAEPLGGFVDIEAGLPEPIPLRPAQARRQARLAARGQRKARRTTD